MGSRDLMWLTMSVRDYLALVLECWRLWLHVHIIATLNSTIFVPFQAFFTTHPTPPTQPFVYSGPILINSMKNWQKLLLTRLVVQKLIDN